mmetsp:Transcript_55290/g.134297  ORF Transcript_55290/g.134297 Transcript_55290/m.134297 type:complete len:288 (+) Transcript_55290:94-957(+)
MTTATTNDTLFAVMGSTDFSDLGDFLGEAFDDVSPDPALSVLPASSVESESESHILMDRDRVPVSPEIAASDIQVQHPALTLAPELTARISPTPKSVPIVGESSSDEADNVVSSPSVSSTNKTKIKSSTSTTTSAKRSRTSSSASTTKKAGSSGPSSSSASSSSSSSVCSDDSNGGGADDDVLKKKIRRRERNREHAKKCRSRKKNYLKTLEESVVDLRRDNDKLRRLVLTKFTKDEIATLLKEDPAMAAALKTSGVDTTTVAATATSPPTTVVTSTDTSSTSSLTL